MNLVSASEIMAAVAQTGDFRPVVKSVSAFLGAVSDELSEDRGSSAPSPSSTRLRDRLHFRAGEVTVWAGYNGHRKSMFLGQVVADLMCAGQRVMVMSMEMSPAATVARIARQMSACAAPDFDWLMRWCQWGQRRLWLFDYLGRIAPDLALGAAYWFANTAKNTDLQSTPHIVIDSLMMVCASEEQLDAQKQLMTDLVRFAQETESHVHLVAHCRKPARDGEDEPPTKYELRGSAAISDQAHNVVTVWANKAKARALSLGIDDPLTMEKPDALITVEKQRNGRFEGRVSAWFDAPTMRFMDDRHSRPTPYVLG